MRSGRYGWATTGLVCGGMDRQVWHRMVSPGGVGLGDAGVDRLVAVSSGSFGQGLAGVAREGKVRQVLVGYGAVWQVAPGAARHGGEMCGVVRRGYAGMGR